MTTNEELRALAEAVPKREREWDHQPYGQQTDDGDYLGGYILNGHGEYLVHDPTDIDGAFIAAANPARVLALLDEVEMLRAQVRVRALVEPANS